MMNDGSNTPPFKLGRVMKGQVEYERMTWDALRTSINASMNRVSAANIKQIIRQLFGENLIRGRGFFCRSCIRAQMASPDFTRVFAALVAVVNSKFPDVGYLLLSRIVLLFQWTLKMHMKPQLLAAVKFIAHLVNQQVVHELIVLEVVTLLLETPTDDNIEVAIAFVTECGSILQDLCPKDFNAIFGSLRGILCEEEIDKRVQFLIEGLFALRRARFRGYPAIRKGLDLVKADDQFTHRLSILHQIDDEVEVDIFKPDPDYLENEERYEQLKQTLLGEESEDDNSESDDEKEESDEAEEDETETNLENLRREIYLLITSSADFEEAGHKLMKIKLEVGQEMELCIMLLECCSQDGSCLGYYGLLGQRLCMINKVYQENFEKCFVQLYSTIHRLDTNKLSNVATFFAHLLGTDALPWHALAYIRLTDQDTSCSSRIFIKILFLELSESLGIRLLNERLSDPKMQNSLESIFPRDNPKNTLFSINFFSAIGLSGITENLREYLKSMHRQQQNAISETESSSERENDERRKKPRRY